MWRFLEALHGCLPLTRAGHIGSFNAISINTYAQRRCFQSCWLVECMCVYVKCMEAVDGTPGAGEHQGFAATSFAKHGH